jgi:hypothetical protein
MRTWEKLPTVVLKCLFRALQTQNINGRIGYNNGKVATNATNSDIFGQARGQNVQISHIVVNLICYLWNVICPK